MEIYVSINGVLRNFIQKFDYHYRDCYLTDPLIEENEENKFEYGVVGEVRNDDLTNHYLFQSRDEFNHFTYIEYPLEIFGHAGLSTPTSVSDLNKLIYRYKNSNFTVVGLDELGKSKSSTLFFLSKNGFLGNNIKFITSEDIHKEWKKCDVWVSDDENILKASPRNKIPIKFNTTFNTHFHTKHEINDILKIEEICLKFLESPITSILTRLLKRADSTPVKR